MEFLDPPTRPRQVGHAGFYNPLASLLLKQQVHGYTVLVFGPIPWPSGTDMQQFQTGACSVTTHMKTGDQRLATALEFMVCWTAPLFPVGVPLLGCLDVVRTTRELI